MAEQPFETIDGAWCQYVGYLECDQFCTGFPDVESAVADYIEHMPVNTGGEPAPSWLFGAMVAYIQRDRQIRKEMAHLYDERMDKAS